MITFYNLRHHDPRTKKIKTILKIETDIITIIASSPMGQAVKMYVLTLHADVIDLSVKS